MPKMRGRQCCVSMDCKVGYFMTWYHVILLCKHTEVCVEVARGKDNKGFSANALGFFTFRHVFKYCLLHPDLLVLRDVWVLSFPIPQKDIFLNHHSLSFVMYVLNSEPAWMYMWVIHRDRKCKEGLQKKRTTQKDRYIIGWQDYTLSTR